MCITSAPAKLSDTVLYGFAAERDGKNVHVLGSQNKVKNLTVGGNAMILPIPAAEYMGQDNLIDTSGFPTILKNMADALPKNRSKARSFSKGLLSDNHDAIQVFNVGIYTIVLAAGASPAQISDALYNVPADKRPNIKPELIEAYHKWYPDWHIAICCFNNKEAKDAAPILLWYVPIDPEELFFPAVDCHTGDVPDLRRQVPMDHTIIVGSVKGLDVTYTDMIPANVKTLLSNKVIGQQFSGGRNNTDFWANIGQATERNMLRISKRYPPGAYGTI